MKHIYENQPLHPTSADILELKRLGHLNNVGTDSPYGITLKQHMVIEFTKSFTTSGSFRRMSLLSRILLFFGLQGYKVFIDYAFTENVKSAIELADEVIKQLNEEE